MEKKGVIIYRTLDGKTSISLYSRNGTVWLHQGQIAELFDTSKQNISLHIINILKDKELLESSVVKDYLTTASDGKEYTVSHYTLPMILAIGFRVRSVRGVQFRQWANTHLQEYITKGFVIDDERLKNPDGRPDHFDELLARIRDIRASEKRFYQKIRDLLALSIDYDSSDESTQIFFSEIQNKLLFAVTRRTAAEIIVDRADATKENMGLTSWKGSIVRKQDIYIAKNYLTVNEIDTLNRLTVIFLETAELRAKNREETDINFWRENVDKIIQMNDKLLLTDKGSITNEEMKSKTLKQYEQFDSRRKSYEAELADAQDMNELHEIEDSLKNRNKK